MTATHSQHKYVHGYLLPDFMEALGIESTKENVLAVKEIFKKYLKVGSTAALSDGDFSKFASAVSMLAAREFGVEIPKDFADKTMRDLFKEAEDGFNRKDAGQDT